MSILVYYTKEKKKFEKAYNKQLNIKTAEIVFKKLSRHYKINPCLVFTSGRNHAKAFGTYKVILNKDYNNFGILCHELAHILASKKFGRIGHCKRHWNIMKRMIAYCEKKNWFEEELNRRTTPKEMHIPNAVEIRQKELIKAQEKIVKYEKKIVFYQRKLSKARRSLTMKQKWINKKEEDKEAHMILQEQNQNYWNDVAGGIK